MDNYMFIKQDFEDPRFGTISLIRGPQSSCLFFSKKKKFETEVEEESYE